MTERWLPVEGFPDYEVSDQGGVRSLGRQVVRKNGRTMPIAERVLRQYPSKTGEYLTVTLCRDGRTYSRKVHHLVLEAFVGPRPVGTECRHGPEGKSDNSLQNLQWGTPSENTLDQVRDGVHNNASLSSCRKVTTSPWKILTGWATDVISVLALANDNCVLRTSLLRPQTNRPPGSLHSHP